MVLLASGQKVRLFDQRSTLSELDLHKTKQSVVGKAEKLNNKIEIINF